MELLIQAQVIVKYFFKNTFVNTRGYPWIHADMKKIGGHSHDRYPTDMGTGMGRIFIQRVGCGGATTRTLPAPLTFLVPSLSVFSSTLLSILI